MSLSEFQIIAKLGIQFIALFSQLSINTILGDGSYS